MADFVLHGVGKPRLDVITPEMISNVVDTSNSTSVALTSAEDLTDIDRQFGLLHAVVSSFNSSDEVTVGKITGWDDGTDTLTVNSWSNGNPSGTKDVTVQGLQIDLPFCEKLTERFTPDFIEKKMLNGDIRIRRRGFYYNAGLSYNRYAHKDTVTLFRALFSTQYSDYTFFPRSDNILIKYKVDLVGDLDYMWWQLTHHQGHGGWNVALQGTRRLSEVYMYEVVASGYGTAYGTLYGSRL